MSTWLTLALIGPIIWGFSNVVDNLLLKNNHIQNETLAACLTTFSRIPIIIGLFFFFEFQLPPAPTSLTLLAIGSLWSLAMYLYYKGIHKEDPSTIALTIQMMPIFTLLFAALILQETLTSHQLAAFILIFSGGLTIGLKQGAKISFSKAVLMVLGSAVIWGFGDVIFKLTEPSVPNYGMALSLFFSGAIITMSMVLLFNKKAQAELKRASKKSLGTLMGMQLFDTLGEVAFFYALTIGKASLTAVISLVQPLSAFIFGTILAYFIPHLKTEDLSPFSLAKKGTAFLLILYGLTLL